MRSFTILYFCIASCFTQPLLAASSAVETALETGDARLVLTDTDLVIAALEEIDASQALLLDAKKQLFNLNAEGAAKNDGSSLISIDWDPTHDAALLIPTVGQNVGVLQTNSVAVEGYTVYNKQIAIAGETAQSRYLVMGSNPLRNAYRGGVVNDQMHQFMKNSLSWLTKRNDLTTQVFNVVIAQMGQGYYFPDEVATRAWLDQHYSGQVSYNDADACDNTQLVTCLTETTDLLIISQVATTDDESAAIAATVEQALDQGIPVLYMHYDGNQTALGKALFDLFNVTYHEDNYWRKLSLSAYDITQNLTQLPNEIQKIKRMLTHFRDQDYAFDWSACDKENCAAVIGLDTEFGQGADEVRSMMQALDIRKQNIFVEDGFRLQKLLALIGDRFRQDVAYPMDKVDSNDTDFLKSYYADHAVYNFRRVNPAQPDMGNFSRSDFSHITPTQQTVNLISKRYFRSAGVYALPGKTFKVTRNDHSELTVKVFINTLRSGATHQWANNGYKRPKYLKSAAIALKPGETIELTSPYGGPIQFEFSTNDLPVEVTFENIGEHPYWSSSADDVSFTQKLDAGDYDWAELVTPGFEIHSTLEKMRKSMADTKWGNAQALATGTLRYMHNFPHVLAGFKGPGIDVVPEIHDFADAKNWSIDNLDKVKHMNADQASCGYGCSGNPYDAYWSYDPIGHGDVHELGHGLQGGMRFIGWENHSMTNHYSYYTKSKYHQTTAGNPSCQSLPFKAQFNVLQASINQVNPEEYMKTEWWDKAGWSQQASMFIQMMMSAQNNGALKNGWHVRARLHIMEREFYRADNNEESWLAKRDSLGFSQYSLTEAKAVDHNDWLLIAISVVTGMDYRDYLSMWGIPFSTKADAQVASFAYTATPRKFYMSSANGYCTTHQNGDFLAKSSLPVDGTQSWPEETDNDDDGYWDALDNCPAIANPDQLNTDNDHSGNACDSDDDGDGVIDEEDAYPLDAHASAPRLVYVPLDKPCRIVDTRGFDSSFDTDDNAIQSFRAWGSKTQLDHQRDTEGSNQLTACQANTDLAPAAMAANITVAAKRYHARGNIVAYASGNPAPDASLINFQGNNIANSSIISLRDESEHHFDVQAQLFGNEPGNQRKADVIVDVTGYFYPNTEFKLDSGLTYVPLPAPCRIIDTRGFNSPFNPAGATQSFQAWGSKIELDAQRDIDGSDEFPACQPELGETPSALVANVTAAAKRYQARGNIVVYPYGTTAPDSSLINFQSNNIANSAILSLNSNGASHIEVQARLFGNEANNQQKVDVVIDAIGYFYPQTTFENQLDRPDMAYTALSSPCRIVDTRGFDSPFEQTALTTQSFQAWGANTRLRTQRDADDSEGLSDCLPASGVAPAALVANTTVVAKRYQARGNIGVYQYGAAAISESSLINFQGNNIANASILSLNSDSSHHFDIQARLFGDEAGNQRKADVIVDAMGYFYPLTAGQ